MTTDEITGREERIEVMLDPSTAGWRPGNPCPECGHSVVHRRIKADAPRLDLGEEADTP